MNDLEFTVEDGEGGAALSTLVRRRCGESWARVKAWIASGKVSVDGETERDAGRRVGAGRRVALRMAAPRGPRGLEVRLVFEDEHLVVIDKPAGMSSVPYEEGERGTALDAVRDAWRRLGRPATATPLHVVHRIDRETSGLLVFAKSKGAERGLGDQFRAHTARRTYLCVAHGAVTPCRIETRLVADRGDGLRGSARGPGGKQAITHVRPLRPLAGATLVEVRLETGKTHQIRIHLAEGGHPLVGERVYIRDYLARGAAPLPAPRLLLHAATLGFTHPVTGAACDFESPLPADFAAELAALELPGRPEVRK